MGANYFSQLQPPNRKNTDVKISSTPILKKYIIFLNKRAIAITLLLVVAK